MEEVTIQVVGSFLAAAFGWVVLEFVGRPLRKFFDLRGEVIRKLIEYANIRARWKIIKDDSGAISGEREDMKLPADEIARMEEAQRSLRDLAAQMRAFAENETWARWLARLLRYNPRDASSGLVGLSNSLDTYGEGRDFHRKTLRRALRLSDDL
jgi:hypothetical protein